MKKKIVLSLTTLMVLLVVNVICITNPIKLIERSGLNLSALIATANADSESGGEKKHSQVVGCGSHRMEDWKAGCCAGTGGCTDNCNKTPDYCD